MGRSRRPNRPRPTQAKKGSDDDETRWVSKGSTPAKGPGQSTVGPLDTDGLLADPSEPGTRPLPSGAGEEPETELMLPTPRAFRGRDSETVPFLKAPEPDPPRAEPAKPKRRRRAAKATTVLIDSDLTQLRSKPMPRRRRPKAKRSTPKRSTPKRAPGKAREAKAASTPKRRSKAKRKEIPIDSSSSRIFNPDLSDPLLQRLATGFMVVVTIFVCLFGGALLGTLF
ncbi:MAG: hypothetical protein KTR31_13155 [Myxococcales bacterium]|nr:hypothetical protein [Myxococcales bacterium]